MVIFYFDGKTTQIAPKHPLGGFWGNFFWGRVMFVHYIGNRLVHDREHCETKTPTGDA